VKGLEKRRSDADYDPPLDTEFATMFVIETDEEVRRFVQEYGPAKGAKDEA
jgi:hypothetical protein